MTDLIFLLWPLVGVAHFLYTTGGDEWKTDPAWMMWGLFLSFIFGPIMIVGYFLSGAWKD